MEDCVEESSVGPVCTEIVGLVGWLCGSAPKLGF